MLKKIIQILLILILLIVLLSIVIFVFNPMDLRTKIIGGAVNAYLSNTIKDYAPLNTTNNQNTAPVTDSTDKNPLLNAQQEKILEDFGVDVAKLPTEITPSMQTCFIDILGEERATELANGATPSAFEVIKTSKCLGE